MLKLRYRNGGVSAVAQVIVIVVVLALIGAGIYIATTPTKQQGEQPPGDNEVSWLSITAESLKTVGQLSSITVYAYDSEGNPVSGANISLSYTISGGRESWWDTSLQLVDHGDGSYTSSMTSQWAGTYTVTAWVEGTVILQSDYITFVPGEAADVIISSTSSIPSSSEYTSELTFYFVDAYNNIVPQDAVNVDVETDFGYLGELQDNPDDTFSINISTTGWGTSHVTITDSNSGTSGSEVIEFTPVYMTLSHNLVDPEIQLTSEENLEFTSYGDEQTLSLDVGIFFPPSLGTLGVYHLSVEYDNSILNPVSISDPDSADNFEAPSLETFENIIYLSQTGSTDNAGVNVATIVFEPVSIGGTTITISVIELQDNEGTSVEIPAGYVLENGKVLEKLFVPLKFWVAPGAGVSDDDLRERAEKAENVYNKNAKECRLKYWHVFLVQINQIPENEWNAKAPDNYVTLGNVPSSSAENLASQVGWEKWINVYVVPENGLHYREHSGAWVNDLGWRVDNGRIFYDPHLDSDNLTLPHELIHELSKSAVKDSPSGQAPAQGGRDNGNIMNYDNTGESISENQGNLINGATENNSEQRPAGQGGGRIYRPRG